MNYASPFVVITEDFGGKEMNSAEGIAMYKIVGYDAYNNRELTGWVSPSSEAAFAGVKKGDVVRLGTDSEGYYTLNTDHILFGMNVNRDAVKDPTNSNQTATDRGGKYHQFTYGISDGGSTDYPLYRVIWGSVKAKEGGFVSISSELITGGTADAFTDVYDVEYSKFNSAKIYKYSNVNGTLEMTPLAGEEAIEYLTAAKWSDADGSLMAAPSQVFVYLSANSVRLMIIVE